MTEETTVEQTEGTTVPDENAVSSPADEPKEVESGNTDTPADTADPKDIEKPDEKRRNKVSAEDRINQLTREKYEQKRRADELEQRFKEVEAKVAANQPEIKKPRYSDFDTEEEFDAAVHDYHKKVAAQEQETQRRQETQQEEARRKQAESNQAAQKFVSDLQKEKANYDGIDDVMKDEAFALITQQMSPDIIALIQSSDKNVALTYHLGTHLDEAERIATLPPVRAARELALLESRLELPTPKTISNAPDPIKSANGKTVTEKDPSKMTDKEFAEWRKKTMANRR